MSLVLLIVLWTLQKERKSIYLTDILERIIIGLKILLAMQSLVLEFGLRGLLMDHPYNQKWDGPRVKNWKEVYEIITNDDATY